MAFIISFILGGIRGSNMSNITINCGQRNIKTIYVIY